MKKISKMCLVLVLVLSLATIVSASYKCQYCETGYMQPENDTFYDAEYCPNPICEISVGYYATWDECDFSSCGEIEHWECDEISRYHIDSGCPYQ
ncbi:MAG: hypothetical protein KAH14_05840 [Clostridiales bacterium]|nr:hypothetical protein [Clostridiales bacterium]